MFDTRLGTRAKDWLYRLQSARHARRWRSFAAQNTSVPRFGIILFVRNHPGATNNEIIEHLMSTRDYGERESCAKVVTRNLKDMQSNGQIDDLGGTYRVHDHAKFVIREEEPWFSWFFLASVGLAIAFFTFTLSMVQFNLHTVVAIILFAIIFIRFIDDIIHTTAF